MHSGPSSRFFIPFAMLAAFVLALGAAEAEQGKKQLLNLAKDGLALRGYDPVAYFTDKQPRRGKVEISAVHADATYRFADKKNRTLFLENPEKYLPAYGGWCATALADGKLVDINPKSYKLTDGRLYLFYKGIFADARKDWLKDEAGLTIKADRHWAERVAAAGDNN